MARFIAAPHPKLVAVINRHGLKDSFPLMPNFLILIDRYYKNVSLDAIKSKFSLDDARIGELIEAYEEDEAYLEKKRLDDLAEINPSA